MNVTQMSREDLVGEMLAPLIQQEPVRVAADRKLSHF